MNQDAVNALYADIGSLPDPEWGSINLLPFAVDSEGVNALKRRVCESIVRLLEDNGFLADSTAAPAEPSRRIVVNCRACSANLVTLRTDASGVANVPAAAMISGLSQLNPGCPHKKLTLDDQRVLIQQAVAESEKS